VIKKFGFAYRKEKSENPHVKKWPEERREVETEFACGLGHILDK
jgi:hypothetical protein